MTTAIAKAEANNLKIDRARALLAEVKTAEDAKRIVDLAHAAKIFGQRQKLAKESIDNAHAVMIDAVAVMGEMLKTTDKATGAKGIGPIAVTKVNRNQPLTLAEVGISKRESSNSQAIAEIKKNAPRVFEQVRRRETTVAKARLELKRIEYRKQEQVETKAAAKIAAKSSTTDENSNWEIIQGEVGNENKSDCALKKIQPESVRLIFCDPPYNIGFDYGEGHDDEQADDDYLAWAGRWLERCIRLLTPDGSLWVLINDEYAAEYAIALKDSGLTIRNWIIWYETFGVNCANKFNRTKRHLFYTVKDPKKPVFDVRAVSRPSDRQLKYNDARANPNGKILDDVWLDIPRLVGSAKERIPDFPTQLPLALLRRIIGCTTKPGDTVLDPCSGSATTGAAAIELGRRYVGIERSAKFAESSRARLRKVRHGALVGEGT